MLLRSSTSPSVRTMARGLPSAARTGVGSKESAAAHAARIMEKRNAGRRRVADLGRSPGAVIRTSFALDLRRLVNRVFQAIVREQGAAQRARPACPARL